MIDYAKRLGTLLHVVNVTESESPELAAHRVSNRGLSDWKATDAVAMLQNVVRRGAQAGIAVSLHQRSGAVAAEILAAANELDAGLLVLALVDRPNHSSPYVGSQTLRVLEFATIPVLVIPVAVRSVTARRRT